MLRYSIVYLIVSYKMLCKVILKFIGIYLNIIEENKYDKRKKILFKIFLKKYFKYIF